MERVHIMATFKHVKMDIDEGCEFEGVLWKNCYIDSEISKFTSVFTEK